MTIVPEVPLVSLASVGVCARCSDVHETVLNKHISRLLHQIPTELSFL